MDNYINKLNKILKGDMKVKSLGEFMNKAQDQAWDLESALTMLKDIGVLEGIRGSALVPDHWST